MVGELAARHALSKEVVDGVSERTGGVPLFVEEVTRLLLERGEVGGLQAIPPTLQQSLAARLDRLGDAREVAQIGAVLGRDFTYALLSAVGGLDASALQSALDRLAGADLLYVEGAGHEGNYRFKHALIQDAAYDSLLKSRRQALHRRAAEVLVGQPERAAAEPEVIAHHFTQAGLDDLAIEWWGKAGDQALRRSAFQEAIAHLGKAIEMADKGAGTSGERGLLHVAYGNALFAARGPTAPETRQAFARVREQDLGNRGAREQLAAEHGLWVASYLRGELPAMRAHAAAFLADVEAKPNSPEASVAHRAAGVTAWFAGEYRQARDHLERALALFEPGRDDNLAIFFGQDAGVSAMANLAQSLWPLGEVDRAISLIERMLGRIADVAHVGTLAFARHQAAMFELIRGDSARAARNASELGRVLREHDLPLFRASHVFLDGWASGRLPDMRRAIELLREQNVLWFDGLLKIVLAEAEAGQGDPERGVALIDEAIATAERTGYRAFEAELHRARGEILLKRDPANPAHAGESFRSAVAVAKQQGARSFELRAALALAKLYQSTARHADAHAVLAPALEGFSPTPDMPEIAEAQAMLAALAETDEVKGAEAQRQRRLHLQTAYGNALIAARGFGAPETTEAFAKAREAAYGEQETSERLAADYGLWAGSYIRGDLQSMRAYAAAFRTDVQLRPESPEAGVASRAAGVTHLFAGEYVEARDRLERALALFRPGRDDDLAFLFGIDAGVAAMLHLAHVLWPLGDVGGAVSLVVNAQARITGLTHIGTLANGRLYTAMFELIRGCFSRAAPNAFELARLAREHDLPMWGAFGVFLEGLVRAESDAPGDGLQDMRRGVELLRDQNAPIFDGLIRIALAEAEAGAGDVVRGLAILGEALATCERAGHRAYEAELHRVRGEMLLRRVNPVPAEEAFQAAIVVAKQQGTRSFELRAALSLAKLYQSTGRAADAHDALAPALGGFSPTPEMPEIAEAQALLVALEETDQVKADAARRRRAAQLRVAYGNALIATRGAGARETTEAFTRARESASGYRDGPERLAIHYGLWAGSYRRAELPAMRAHSAAFLTDVEGSPDSPEAGIAHRICGVTHQFAGEHVEARDHLERALALFQPGRDDDLAFRFGFDAGVAALGYLAISTWAIGDTDRATSLVECLQARIADITNANSHAFGNLLACMFQLMRRDRARAAPNAVELARTRA